jgi:hypothetical protein
MALLFPWATKEYLLWEMSIGQIIMYHNIGIEIKYPDPENKSNLSKTDIKSLKDINEQMRKENEEKELMRIKYGAIE